MKQGNINIVELQKQIGVTEELTDYVLNTISLCKPSSTYLPIYNLLLLERYEATVPMIKQVMDMYFDMEYVFSLQKSKFYIQRLCVPYIINDIPEAQRKIFLKISLRDSICVVVKEAVKCIVQKNPYNKEELLEIAIDLFGSRRISTRILCIDILVLIGESRHLLYDILRENCWRMRLRCAQHLNKFNENDQDLIISLLKNDEIVEVRSNLAANLHSLSHMYFLNDESEFVRSAYLLNIINKIQDQTIFDKILSDQSWEVRKVLLNLRGEWFKKITIPLIKTCTSNVKWRTKIEVLDLIENQIQDNFVARLMTEFMIKTLYDKVYMIRLKAQAILIKMIGKYDWMYEFIESIEKLVKSDNYLYRIIVVPIAGAFDMRFKTNFLSILQNDKIINVRDCLNDWFKELKMSSELSGQDSIIEENLIEN